MTASCHCTYTILDLPVLQAKVNMQHIHQYNLKEGPEKNIEGSTVIAPKHQPLISLKTNWCSMLTSFTLISGIKKNTGCNVWREGGRGGSGGWWDWGNYPLMLHQRTDERGGGRKRWKRKLCKGSHRLQGGVREETERIEARRNRGIGRRKEKISEGGGRLS